MNHVYITISILHGFLRRVVWLIFFVFPKVYRSPDAHSQPNMLVYKLGQSNINGEKLLNDIQNLINKHQPKDADLLLCITIKSVSYTDTSLIPKIEYKPNCTT